MEAVLLLHGSRVAEPPGRGGEEGVGRIQGGEEGVVRTQGGEEGVGKIQGGEEGVVRIQGGEEGVVRTQGGEERVGRTQGGEEGVGRTWKKNRALGVGQRPDLLRRREHAARGMRVRNTAQLPDQTRSSPSSTSAQTAPANSPYSDAASWRGRRETATVNT